MAFVFDSSSSFSSLEKQHPCSQGLQCHVFALKHIFCTKSRCSKICRNLSTEKRSALMSRRLKVLITWRFSARPECFSLVKRVEKIDFKRKFHLGQIIFHLWLYLQGCSQRQFPSSKPQANFPALLKQKKLRGKRKFGNMYGVMKRTYLRCFIAANEQIFLTYLSRMKMLNITSHARKLLTIISALKSELLHSIEFLKY